MVFYDLMIIYLYHLEVMNVKNTNTGLSCLVLLGKLNEISLSADEIEHNFSIEGELAGWQMVKIARSAGLKGKELKTDAHSLKKLNPPIILRLNDGSYTLLVGINNSKFLLYDVKDQKSRSLEEDELNGVWSGDVIAAYKKGKSLSQEIFGIKWFLPTILKYKRAIVEILTAVFTVQLIGLLTPIMMQVIIDKVLVHRSFSTLNVLVGGLIVATIFEMILTMGKTYIFSNTTSKIDVILNARLFNHLFRLPLRYFEERRVGDTVARVRELENIRRFLTGTPLTLVLDCFFIFVYLLVMFFYSKTLTLMILGSFPLYILLSISVTPALRERLNEKFSLGADMNSFLVESVSGIQTVKALSLEPKFQKRWEETAAEYTKVNFTTSILGGGASTASRTLHQLVDLVILWTGAKLVIEGSISVGQLIAFRMLAGRVSSPVLRIISLWQEFQQVRVSLGRIADVFKIRPEPQLSSTRVNLPPIVGEIVFEGVSFRYRPDTPEALRNLSLKIPKGKIVGVVGRSGAGKSTLAKLIQRLYIPERGKILVDGYDISLADHRWLRRQIGVVLQESFLFNGTIKENITINKATATMEEVVEAAKIAGAHDFISDFPEGYDTKVGEKGSSLSGGQKQRIAIARAIITNPRILIFDEATSALDYESERAIQENLSRISHGRTLIIIAHRLSTLRDAHYIAAMDRGEMIEFDTPENLLQKKGLYHYLYNQQH